MSALWIQVNSVLSRADITKLCAPSGSEPASSFATTGVTMWNDAKGSTWRALALVGRAQKGV